MKYLPRVLLAQAVDHVFSLLWVGLLLGVSLAVSEFPVQQTLQWAGPMLWFASGGIFLVTGVGFRMLSLRYLSATPGQLLTGLRIGERSGSRRFVRGMIFESLQPAFPVLWLADLAMRRRGRPLAWSYSYAFEERFA